MVPWVLSLFRPRLSYFFKGTLRRYLFWSVMILFGGPYVLKDEYAKPILSIQHKVIDTFKSFGRTMTPQNGDQP